MTFDGIGCVDVAETSGLSFFSFLVGVAALQAVVDR